MITSPTFRVLILYSLEDNNFGVNAVFAILTHEDVVLIASNAEAAAW